MALESLRLVIYGVLTVQLPVSTGGTHIIASHRIASHRIALLVLIAFGSLTACGDQATEEGPAAASNAHTLLKGHRQSLVAASGLKTCSTNNPAILCEGGGCQSGETNFYVQGADCPADPDSKPRMSSNAFALAHAASSNAELLSKAQESDPDEEITFMVMTNEVPFDFSRFRTAEGSARAALVAERQQDLKPAEDAAAHVVEALGGDVLHETWVTPGLIISAKAKDIPAILASPLVLSGSIEKQSLPSTWDGVELTDGVRTQEMFLNSPEPYNGQIGSRELKIGIVESESPVTYSNDFNCTHDGWNDWAGGPSRVKSVRRCTSSTCASSNVCTTTTNFRHSTTVGWVAAGSIEQGQDTSFPGSQTTAQRQRSGHAQEAAEYVWVATNGNSTATYLAIEEAIADGVDVLNMSFGYGSASECNLSYNPTGVRGALLNAFNAGILLVGAAGDNGGACHVEFPANLSYVMSVGALGSTNANASMTDLTLATYSPYGAPSVSLHGGGSKSVPLIDLLAPGDVTCYFTGTSSFDCKTTAWGTSFAAPSVSAVGALTREWMLDLGWSAAGNPRKEFGNILSMGDRYGGSPTPSYEFYYTVSDLSGFGRVQAHWDSTDSLGSDGFWVPFSSTIGNGVNHYWSISSSPLPSGVQGLKVSLAWFDGDYSDVADISLDVYDACTGAVLRTASSAQVMRKQIQLTGSEIRGKCPWIHLYGTSVFSGGEDYYGSAYVYSNSPSVH